MESPATMVELYRPTVDTAPVAYIYDAGFQQASEPHISSGERHIGVIQDSLAFYDSVYGQNCLFMIANNEENIKKSMKKLQGCLDDLFQNSTKFDYQSLNDGKKPVSLAKLGYYERPTFTSSSAESDLELEFVKFFEYVGKILHTPAQKFELLQAVEMNYFPLRFFRRI